MREELAFSYTGVDFADPLFVRMFTTGQNSKVQFCLYTFCITRAVHLDAVPNLFTETSTRSLNRFAAGRGLPWKFTCDNGKTFKAAAKRIKEVLRQEAVQNHLSSIDVEWAFNLWKALWWGGVFERTVKSTKRCLRKMIGPGKFSLDELQTTVIEVESINYSRTLSYLSMVDW